MNALKKLAHCPFCGSTDVVYDEHILAVTCEQCACEGPFAGLERGTNVRQKATDRWNERREMSAVNPWFDASNVLPDEEITVLICNTAWSDPVTEGYLSAGVWFTARGSALNTPPNVPNPDHHPETEPPTYWMHLPEPPDTAQVPDIEPFTPANPFARACGIVCDSQDRLEMVKRFTIKQCEAALLTDGLQKVVRGALMRSITRLDKEAGK